MYELFQLNYSYIYFFALCKPDASARSKIFFATDGVRGKGLCHMKACCSHKPFVSIYQLFEIDKINLKILFAPRSQFNQFSQSNICMSLKKKVYKSMKLMFQVERKKNPTFYESVVLVSSAGPSIFIVYHNILWHHIFCWNIRNNYMQITSILE